MEEFEGSFEGTPFTTIVIDGKPHLATPLTILSQNVSQKAAYLGSKDRYVRGIPVREWLLCTTSYSGIILYRVKVSYSSEKVFANLVFY